MPTSRLRREVGSDDDTKKALFVAGSRPPKYALGEFDVEVTLKDCEDKTKETNCKVVGLARGTATPGVPSGQTRSFNTSDLEFGNLPREVQVRCVTQPCNVGRVFNWRVTEIRASQ